MKKGDKITLIRAVKEGSCVCTPGPSYLVTILEEQDGILTVGYSDSIDCGYVIIKETRKGYVIFSFSVSDSNIYDGKHVPAVMTLRSDWLVDKMMSEECLAPQINRQKMRYDYAMPAKVLDAWVSLDIIRKRVVDSYYGCPECHGICSTRNGCVGCMGIELRGDRLMRHEPCGAVGFQQQFCRGQCFGCHDWLEEGEYTFLDGPKKCETCGIVNYNKNPVLFCLNCERTVCTLEEAEETPVYSYYKP